MQPKFVAAQKMLLKRNLKHSLNGLLGFITLRHYPPLEARRIAHNNYAVTHQYGQLYLLLGNILLSSFQLFFCIMISLSLRVEIIPFSGVCQSGGGLHYPRRRRWWLHALTDRLLCYYDKATTSGNIIPQRASFSALASANSFVYFASGAATSR